MTRMPLVWIAATASLHAFPTFTCHFPAFFLSADSLSLSSRLVPFTEQPREMQSG